jgi:hypothetical protein
MARSRSGRSFAENSADPEQWNRYAYVRNNPLRLVDPDGREVTLLDARALERIASTVLKDLRAAVVLGDNGMLDERAWNAIETADPIFWDRRAAANDAGLMEVNTARTAPRPVCWRISPPGPTIGPSTARGARAQGHPEPLGVARGSLSRVEGSERQ